MKKNLVIAAAVGLDVDQITLRQKFKEILL